MAPFSPLDAVPLLSLIQFLALTAPSCSLAGSASPSSARSLLALPLRPFSNHRLHGELRRDVASGDRIATDRPSFPRCATAPHEAPTTSLLHSPVLPARSKAVCGAGWSYRLPAVTHFTPTTPASRCSPRRP